MKELFFAILTLFPAICFGQEQKDTTTYAFPVGSRIVLELVQTAPEEYKYHVLVMEPFDFSLDFFGNDTLFDADPVPGTIECIFARGIDQSGPFKTVLTVRNNSKLALQYRAEISLEQNGKFFNTSVEPLLPGVISTELWNDKLTAIVIHKISENKPADTGNSRKKHRTKAKAESGSSIMPLKQESGQRHGE